MATRIIEFGGVDRTDGLPVIPMPNTVQATMTATGTSAQSAAFQAGTTLICVQSDEAICIARGSNPTATSANYKIAAGGEAFFSVTPTHKVAIITA